MPLTVEKLQMRIAELGIAAEGPASSLSPVFVTPATGPMTPAPSVNETVWTKLDVGQVWGTVHGTSWLRAILQISESTTGQPVVLQLRWEKWADDSLLLQLEATVFVDGQAIGGFDWRHPLLRLPKTAGDGQPHELAMPVYTRAPAPFGGLTLHVRNETLWQLYHLMQTALEVNLALDKHDRACHTLLERLNTAYNMLDLREGWRSERLAQSARIALDYLQEHLTDGLTAGSRPHIVVSGHAHLDVGWRWPYWRSRQKIAHTISTVLALMERYPDYYYSQSQPQLLQWLKEDLPDVYARVKERVAEGHFEPVGAMWVEADCNLTSGESLVRQIMHGMRFTEQEFGITPSCIWLPDVFGYSAALPQIMRGCNIPTFMTTKISWNQFNRMPYDTFRWRGIDGTEVLTHFITAADVHATSTYYTYNGPLRPAGVAGTWTNYRQQAINDQLLYLCGWGDGGGGPTEEQLESVKTMADLPGFPTVKMGRVTEYFADLYNRLWDHPRLPTWVGELYLEYHRGTYTSQVLIKQANRRAELFYREVELLNAWASVYGMPSRQERLNEGWRRILLNQFHDVLPGSSIREVYEDAERIYAEARAIGEEVRNEAVAILSSYLSTGTNSLLLLNTLPWQRTDPIQFAADNPSNVLGVQQVTDWDGGTALIADGVAIPSCSVFEVKDVSILAENTQSCSIKQTEAGFIILQNTHYELIIDEHGEIARLYDKRTERDVLAPRQTGNQLIAFEDRPLTYDAWDIEIYYEEKPYPLHEATQVRILEEGPVRATVEVEHRFLSSRITQRISLWRNSPRIDFATEIDWHEHQILLKAAFPVAINSSRATYEIQFGSVERPTHRNTSWDWARFEVCAHRWVDLSEGGYGVSLLNDGKYGHDIHDNVMRLTLLKSSIEPDPDADQGVHRFTYSLLPHRGDWCEAQTVRRAYELNVPLLTMVRKSASSTPGTVETDNAGTRSFVITDCPHVVVETVKPAEDGDGLIVRLYEAHNQRGRGSLTFASDMVIVSAQECNLLETTVGDATYAGNRLEYQVDPFEIKTFRVRLALTERTT